MNNKPFLPKPYAPNDLASTLAFGIGFRDWGYRRKAVDLLHLTKGDHVLEIGCGTGRNFALLEHAVGPSGTITAVDISVEMLGRAQKRATRLGQTSNISEPMPPTMSFVIRTER
jgi:ubiquinone/menaquinone biosynthesis C-methylase UbiE